MAEKINDALRDQLRATLASGLTDDGIARIKKQLSDLVYEAESDLEWHLKDEMASILAGYVVEMAEMAVRAVLNGNQQEMERYLGCERGHWTGRSDSPEFGRKREVAEWHPVIHGRLFEQGAVKLRRDIVDAHKDLIISQRILDLEDQVKSLVEQVNKANAEREAAWERLRGYE